VDTTALRISALAAARRAAGPVILSAKALLQPAPSPAVLSRWELIVRRGQHIDRDELAGKLSIMGYRRQPVVSEVGDLAVRGGILDVFSPLTDKPARIELWGDEVDSLRLFDPQTQRSGAEIKEHLILPVTEILLSPEERKEAEIRLGDHLAAAGAAARERDPCFTPKAPILWITFPENPFSCYMSRRRFGPASRNFTIKRSGERQVLLWQWKRHILTPRRFSKKCAVTELLRWPYSTDLAPALSSAAPPFRPHFLPRDRTVSWNSPVSFRSSGNDL
jgi:hypothetical protein